jgi:hypothetical protein
LGYKTSKDFFRSLLEIALPIISTGVVAKIHAQALYKKALGAEVIVTVKIFIQQINYQCKQKVYNRKSAALAS